MTKYLALNPMSVMPERWPVEVAFRNDAPSAYIGIDVVKARDAADLKAMDDDTVLGWFYPDAPLLVDLVPRAELAKHQPCGCVICTCEGDRCLGCGAKSCGNHPVSEIPNPVYVDATHVKLQREIERLLAESNAAGKIHSGLHSHAHECMTVSERKAFDLWCELLQRRREAAALQRELEAARAAAEAMREKLREAAVNLCFTEKGMYRSCCFCKIAMPQDVPYVHIPHVCPLAAPHPGSTPLADARKRIGDLETVLRDLLTAGWHNPDCSIEGTGPCDCGMEARYAAAKAALAEKARQS
jgi:hypothetical protein